MTEKEKETTVVVPETVDNPMNFTKDIAKGIKKKVDENQTFVSPIKLTYRTSEHFSPGTNEFGDFYFEDKSLGNSIDVWIPYFAYQVLAMDEKKFGGALLWPYSTNKYSETKEYKEFVVKWKKEDYKIDEGVNLQMYLLAENQWASFFCKTLIHKGAVKVINKMISNGQYFFRLSSVQKAGKNYLLLDNEAIEAQDHGIELAEVKRISDLLLRKDEGKDVKKAR